MTTSSFERRLVPTTAPEADQVRRLITVVADRLQARLGELTDSMNSAILRGQEELNSVEQRDMLYASVEGNIVTILHMLRNNVAVDHMQPVTSATDYGYLLGQVGTPVLSLRRAYHFGSDDLLAFVFDEVRALECSPDLQLRVLHHLSGWLHKYVDEITRQVSESHEEGRRFAAEQAATEVSMLVAAALRGDDLQLTEFAARTGYPLTAPHRAVVVWVDKAPPGTEYAPLLEEACRSLTRCLVEPPSPDMARTDTAEIRLRRATRPPLVTVADRHSCWLWFTDLLEVDLKAVRTRITAISPRLRVAFGGLAKGPEGFRHSHEQALALQPVATASTAPEMTVVSHDIEAMPVIAVLARDLPAARQWVREVLGPLAADTEYAERLRSTLRVFLGSGSSYVAAADRLIMHRNTVKYRIGRAAEELGRSAHERRLDTELALHAALVLGRAVLVADDE